MSFSPSGTRRSPPGEPASCSRRTPHPASSAKSEDGLRAASGGEVVEHDRHAAGREQIGFARAVTDREPIRYVERGRGGRRPARPGRGGDMTTIDPNRVILVGENPFIRLAARDGEPFSTNASFWRIVSCPKGPGHVLFLKSELTQGRWRIWTDNLAMARWLQATVQGMLDAETADLSIPAIDAAFEKEGDPAYCWSERIVTPREELVLTWYDFGEPLLLHTRPHEIPGRRYGVCTVLIPAMAARLALDGVEAAGRAFPRDREGRPFSTCALAFNESWTEERTPG